jgi:hypothetical protein
MARKTSGLTNTLYANGTELTLFDSIVVEICGGKERRDAIQPLNLADNAGKKPLRVFCLLIIHNQCGGALFLLFSNGCSCFGACPCRKLKTLLALSGDNNALSVKLSHVRVKRWDTPA